MSDQHTITETCRCGGSTTVTTDSFDDARVAVKNWRTAHSCTSRDEALGQGRAAAGAQLGFAATWHDVRAQQDATGRLAPGLAGASNPHDSLTNVCAFSARDWSSNPEDAWIYGVVVGWAEALDHVGDQHHWTPEARQRITDLHRQLLAAYPTDRGAVTSPDSPPPGGGR